MIPNELQAAALMTVETAINQALAYDPVAVNAIKALEGKVLAVESTLPPLKLFVLHSGGNLNLLSQYEGEPDTLLKGSAMSLVSLVQGSQQRSSFFGTGVEMKGDSELLRQVQSILKNLDVDWEAALAKLIGDVPAHLNGNSVRSFGGWRSGAVERVGEVISGFHQEEAQLTPPRNECEQFFKEVKLLNKDVDRLGARLNRLAILMDQSQRQEDQ